MTLYEFFEKYSRVPWDKRDKLIDERWLAQMTLSTIYERLVRINNEMKPLNIEKEDLLGLAEIYMNSLPEEVPIKPRLDYRE